MYVALVVDVTVVDDWGDLRQIFTERILEIELNEWELRIDKISRLVCCESSIELKASLYIRPVG